MKLKITKDIKMRAKLSKEKRVEEILKSLFIGKRFTTSELSLKYDVALRVIQKDLKELKEIYPIKKEFKQYFLPDEYIAKDTQDIHPLAMDISMSVVNKTLPKYKDMIQDSLNVKLSNIFLFDFEVEEIKDEKLFLDIKRAIVDKFSVKFNYNSYEKNIYPIKISNFNSYWYLIGYDLEATIIKTFYLDNIENLSILEDKFLSDEVINKLNKIEITSSWYNENPKKTKLILFNEAKKYILRRVPSNIKILKENKDNIEIEFNYFNEIEVMNFIKKWLGNIKLKNNTLKQKMKELLQFSLNNL